MTAIIAYRHGDYIYVASDKRHSFAYGGFYDTANKYTILNDDIHVYATGNALIHKALNGIDVICEETTFKTMKCFTKCLHEEINELRNPDIDFSLMVIVNGDIYVLSQSLDFTLIPSETYSLGSGGELGEGYFIRYMENIIEKRDRDNVDIDEDDIREAFERTFNLIAKRYNNVSKQFDFVRIST